ncbi:MAG: permease [Pseudomonadota bacterium]
MATTPISAPPAETSPCCPPPKKRDPLLWFSGTGVLCLYAFSFLPNTQTALFVQPLLHMGHAVRELVHTMWWGVAIGIFMLSILSRLPREVVMGVLGHGRLGIVRATCAGVLLDLCSHGILMVGAKLYERGASLGQVMAFLIASPWNSFSLTLVLIALIGLKWTVTFVVLSVIVALLSGFIFDQLVQAQVLPANPHAKKLDTSIKPMEILRQTLAGADYSSRSLAGMFVDGLKDSRMVIRWLLFGILLAAILRAVLDAESFASYFGPTLMGLGITMIFGTILEVCSEGSAPIGADMVTRAGAPGNGFAFLMGGVSTDYTEIMVLKETTASWKIALFLPLITLPQIAALAVVLNLSQ